MFVTTSCSSFDSCLRNIYEGYSPIYSINLSTEVIL